MNSVLFLSQKDLDHWLDEGHVDMAQESVDLHLGQEPGGGDPCGSVHEEIVAGTDQHKLIGKVKAVEVMRMGGADCSLGAVVLPDAAYEVEDGFMVTVPTAGPRLLRRQPGRQQSPPAKRPTCSRSSSSTSCPDVVRSGPSIAADRTLTLR